MEKYFNDESLFFKYWYIPSYISEYKKVTHLPGVKEGISGSAIGGYNVGINKYASAEKMDSTLKAFTYLTSKEVQRKVAKDYLFFSPIPSLYDEEEICEELDCEFFKSAQLIARPIDITEDYNWYSGKFREHIFEYLYGNRTASDVLKDIENLTKVYSLSFNDSFSIIIFIIFFIISISMLGSLFFLHIKKYEPYFEFLLKREWYMFIIGLVLMLWNFYSEMEKTTKWRCHLNRHITSFIFYFIFIPILRKLIVCFPEVNKVSEWINHHKTIFLISFIVVDEILISLMLFHPYDVQKHTFIKDGKIIEICKINNGVSKFFIALSWVIKLFVILAICLLVFIEWNIILVRRDINVMAIAIYMDIVLLIAYIIVDHITVNDYTLYFLMKEIIYILIVLMNYMFIYFYRIIKIIIYRNEDKEMELVKNEIAHSKEMIRREKSSNSNIDQKSSTPKGSNSSLAAYKKIVEYHYKTSIGSTSDDNGCTGNISNLSKN